MTSLGSFAARSFASSAGWMTLKLWNAGSPIALPARPSPTATAASKQTTLTFFTQAPLQQLRVLGYLLANITSPLSHFAQQSTDRARGAGEAPANRGAGCGREPL